MMYRCWRFNDRADYMLIKAVSAEEAAEKYIQELAGEDNFEYYEEYSTIEVDVEDENGEQKTFDVVTHTSIYWCAEEKFDVHQATKIGDEN